MIQRRPLVSLVFLLLTFSTDAMGKQPQNRPVEAAPVVENFASNDIPPQQKGSKLSDEVVLELAHTVLADAETHITTTFHIFEALAFMLGLGGAYNIVVSYRDSRKVERLGVTLQRVEADYKELENKRDSITRDLSDFNNREKALIKSMETLRAIAQAQSHLGADTRLRALQQLSQMIDPLAIPTMLQILKGPAPVNLRREAAYGLGRLSEGSAFKEYCAEIIHGFREVLENSKTPPILAQEVVKSARRFGDDSRDLAPLFRNWG